MSKCKVGHYVDMENLKWNTDLIETMELEHVMSQAPQDLDDGKTRHDDGKLKLTNVTKCSGRSTHQGATRKLNSQTSRVEEVCLKNACMSNVHMTCPPPPTQRKHKGWRSAPDAILPGHWKTHHPDSLTHMSSDKQVLFSILFLFSTILPVSIGFNLPEDDAKFFDISKNADDGSTRAGRPAKACPDVPDEFRASASKNRA